MKYLLRVDNRGGLARNLVVSDVLPAFTTFGECDCQAEAGACVSFDCREVGDQVVWSVGKLDADSVLKMTLWVTVDASLSDGASIVNHNYAAVADGAGLLHGSPVTTTVRQFHVSISKTAWPNPVMVGQELTFTINVTKSGGSPLIGVEVTDVLPSGVSYVDGSCEGGITCTLIKDNNEVSWWLGDLKEAYSLEELTVRVTVTQASSGTLVNEFYGVEAKAEGGEGMRARYIMGEPLEVKVLAPTHYVYLPLVLSGSSP
ncbi:MAG: DUF11 domain-containing protein [Chloroflexi bacterium]|nr:DUF11 domain-containing protein [Chloroflexota bacterium]